MTLAPMRPAKAMPWWTAFPEKSDPSVGIRMLVYIVLSSVATLLRQRTQISFRELLADRQQFLPALCARFGISHFKPFERIEDNPRNDQPSVFLVVGGNDIPRGVAGACCTKAFLISQHVLFPKSPLLDIGKAEFPVLFRLTINRSRGRHSLKSIIQM